MKKPKIILIFLLLVILTACAKPVSLVTTSPSTQSAETVLPLDNTPTPTPEPTFTPVQLADSGDKAIFAGDYDAALEIFQSALSASDDPAVIARSNLGIGQAYYEKGNNAAALDHLRQAATAADPVIAAHAQYFMGQSYANLERYDEAIQSYSAFLTLRPGLLDSYVYELQGDLYNTIGNYPMAIASFQEAYRTDPNGGNDTLAIKVAVAYQDSGDTDTALSLYQDIYNTSGSDYTKAQMDLRIGQIYYNQGQTDQAYAYFQDAVNNFPLAYDAYTALVTLVNDDVSVNEFQRGLINYYVGNYALAVEAFDRFLNQAPAEFADTAVYYKALAVRAAGASNGESRAEEADQVWQYLIDTYPTSPFYIDAWEDIEYTQWAYLDEPLQAAETALNFVAKNPEAAESPDFLFLAGRSYERAGQLDLASTTWQRVADEYPDFSKNVPGSLFRRDRHRA